MGYRVGQDAEQGIASRPRCRATSHIFAMKHWSTTTKIKRNLLFYFFSDYMDNNYTMIMLYESKQISKSRSRHRISERACGGGGGGGGGPGNC